MRHRGIQIAVAVLALGTDACSWILMKQAPKPSDVKTEPRCTATLGWPVLDFVFVAADVMMIGLVVADTGGEVDTTAIIPLAAVDGALHLLSGIDGQGWATACRTSRSRYDRRMLAHPAPTRE